MNNPEDAVYTLGWSPGQRANLLRETVKAQHCEEIMPWKELLETDFFVAPASTKWHGAYEGGLFDHSLSVANVLCRLTKENITDPWSRPASPFLVGIFHDLTKLYKYVTNDTGDGFKWAPTHDLPVYGGHGAESVIRAQQWMDLTEEEIMCIRFHMGAYETDDWDIYDLAVKKYHNVLWTHTADMIVSKFMDK